MTDEYLKYLLFYGIISRYLYQKMILICWSIYILVECVYDEMETPIPASAVLDIRCCVIWFRKQPVVTHRRLLSDGIMLYLTQDFIDHQNPYIESNGTAVV
jgi:hypothetical protein